jgi:outer membrane protein
MQRLIRRIKRVEGLIFAAILIICHASVSNSQEFSTAAMRGITIEDAFLLALSKSESLAQQNEAIAGLEAAERALRSNFLPRLDFNGTRFQQDTPDSTVQPSKTQGMFSIRQSLFSGMRDYLSAKAAGTQTEAAKLDMARARQSLYLNVARAYLDLLAAQWDIDVRNEQLKITRDRLEELRSRERIGRSRSSEVLAAQSQLAQDEAQLQNALGSERVCQQVLKFLTGAQEDMAPAHVSLPSPPAIDGFLRGAEARADISARRKDLETAATRVDIQGRQRWPSLDAEANYYIKRPHSSSGINWDALLTLQIPLYTGGQTGAQTDQASAAKRSAGLALTLVRRQAETEVRQAYETLIYSVSTTDTLSKAMKLARENTQAQIQDYKLGLVTNLDVLNAMNSLLQIRIQHYQAHLQAFWSSIRLDAAGGGPK